jgi:hypothetical protein
MSAGENSDIKPSLEKVSDSQHEDVKLKASLEDDLDFGGESTLPPPPTLSAEEERKLWRKIDLRLMPILTLMYLMSFLDRGTHFRLCELNEFTFFLYRKYWYVYLVREIKVAFSTLIMWVLSRQCKARRTPGPAKSHWKQI